jgi:hypothetical protein
MSSLVAYVIGGVLIAWVLFILVAFFQRRNIKDPLLLIFVLAPELARVLALLALLWVWRRVKRVGWRAPYCVAMFALSVVLRSFSEFLFNGGLVISGWTFVFLSVVPLASITLIIVEWLLGAAPVPAHVPKKSRRRRKNGTR